MKHLTIIDWSEKTIRNVDVKDKIYVHEKVNKYEDYFEFIDAINDITHAIPKEWLENEKESKNEKN